MTYCEEENAKRTYRLFGGLVQRAEKLLLIELRISFREHRLRRTTITALTLVEKVSVTRASLKFKRPIANCTAKVLDVLQPRSMFIRVHPLRQ